MSEMHVPDQRIQMKSLGSSWRTTKYDYMHLGLVLIRLLFFEAEGGAATYE